MPYKIKLWVSGGVTGSREGFHKINGIEKVYRDEDLLVAQITCKNLRDRKMNCNHGASVVKIEEKSC